MTDLQKKFDEWRLSGSQTSDEKAFGELYLNSGFTRVTYYGACSFYAGYHANKSEPVSLEVFIEHGKKCGFGLTQGQWEQLYRFIAPLTVQQGFVPDWSKAPDWATSAVVVWSRQDPSWETEIHRFPRPTKDLRSEIECKTGRKTDGLTDAEVKAVAKFYGLVK